MDDVFILGFVFGLAIGLLISYISEIVGNIHMHGSAK